MADAVGTAVGIGTADAEGSRAEEPLEVQIVGRALLQAAPISNLADLMGRQDARLVFAAQITVLPFPT